MDIKLEIIKLVEKYDCLYNAQSPQNKDFVYKQYLWNEIGKVVGLSGTIAKREFKTVRDNYKKWQNKRITVCGFHKQYKYAEYLKFLDSHMIFRSAPTRTSASLQDVEFNSDVSTDLDLSQMRTDLRLKVIEKVKQHDCLYNIHSPEYNDLEYKQQLWYQFEEELNISAEQIKNIWKHLIDCYKKYKQSTHGKYKYADYLKFLDDYIIPESEPSNETFIISFIDDDGDDEINLDTSNNLDLLVELKTDINVKIIEAVQNHDCLYNINSIQHKDFEYKKELWNQIGQEVGTSAEQAKRRWKSIKDYYRKCKLNTGTKYKYAEYLTFLDDYIVLQSNLFNETTSLSDEEEIVADSSSNVELLDINVDIHEKIIEAVKKYDCLYNALSPQYKNFEYKQELWNEIGNEIGTPVKTIRRKWQYLKDYYIKYKQNRMRTYKYAKHLKFLDDYIAPQSYEEISTDLHLQIIEEVKKYKCLYDAQSVRYKDFEYRQQVWNKIGKKLGITAENVKGKWKHVKDYYKRCKHILNTKYKYAEDLKFLDDYIVMQSKGIHKSISFARDQKGTDLSNSLNVLETYTDINVNLIEAVKKYDCLYNEQSSKYKDFKYKQKLWSNIGKEVGRSKKHVKKKWNNLMYRYKKCKEKILDEGGSLKQYKYMENLTFLDNNITFQRDDQKSSQLSSDTEVNTDLSSDTDILYIPPVKKKKINFENSPEPMQEYLEKPISTKNLKKIENSESTTNQLFENLNMKNSRAERQDDFLEEPILIKKENTTKVTSQWFEKINFRNSLEELQNFTEEPISTNNFNKIETLNLKSSLEEIQNLSENPISIKKEIVKSTAGQLFDKEYCEKPHDFSEEPISIKNLNKIENPKSSTSQWFELLAKKINESNITAEQKNDIEFAVSSLVYSKLAEYSKQS